MRINAYAANLGWLFEDLKSHFLRHGAVVSDSPLPDADAWICIRTGEFTKTPDPARTVAQVHDLYDHEVAPFIEASLVVFTHPIQQLHWMRRGFAGRHITLPIGARSGIGVALANPARPTLGFFCGETPRMEKRSHLFREAVIRARRHADFDVLLIGRNLEHLKDLGRLESRAANIDDYERVDALFTASISPAVPLSVYEACAAGLPVISTPRWFPEGNWPHVFIEDGADTLAMRIVQVLTQRGALLRQRPKAATAPYLLDDWIKRQLDHLRALGEPAGSRRSTITTLPRLAFNTPLALPCLQFGWSQSETWGVWSDGPRARLVFDIEVPSGSRFLVRFLAGAFTTPTLPSQRVGLSINGRTAVTLHLNSPTISEFEVSADDLGKTPHGVWLDFEFPNACSPCDVQGSDDRRRLGISMHWIEMLPLPC